VVAVVVAGFVVVAVAVCCEGAVVVDDELDDLTVVLGVELRALEVAGATGGDEGDPPHAASTSGSAMIQRTFTFMLGPYPSRRGRWEQRAVRARDGAFSLRLRRESASTQSVPALTVAHQSSTLPAFGFLTLTARQRPRSYLERGRCRRTVHRVGQLPSWRPMPWVRLPQPRRARRLGPSSAATAPSLGGRAGCTFPVCRSHPLASSWTGLRTPALSRTGSPGGRRPAGCPSTAKALRRTSPAAPSPGGR